MCASEPPRVCFCVAFVTGVGNPTAGTALNNPMSLAIDSAGNVLIADTENDWILSYNPVSVV